MDLKDYDNNLPEFTDRELEIQAYLGYPQENTKNGLLQSCTWWTGKYGRVTAEMYLPVSKLTSDQVVAELREYLEAAAPRNHLRGDMIKAITIFWCLLDYYEGRANWLDNALPLLADTRGSAKEFVWSADPYVGRDLMYSRYRSGWREAVNA